MTNTNAYKCLVYALKSFVLAKYQCGYTNAVFFFHCMYTEILSQRWSCNIEVRVLCILCELSPMYTEGFSRRERDTATFEQYGLTCYFEIPLPTFTAWTMEPAVILR